MYLFVVVAINVPEDRYKKKEETVNLVKMSNWVAKKKKDGLVF